MKKRLISLFLSLALALTAMISTGVTAGAKQALTVTGRAENGNYIIDLNGLTKKQYTSFVNNEKGYRVELSTAGGDVFIFLAADLMKKSDEPALPGCKNGKKAYCGFSGKGAMEYSTWNTSLSLEGLYGTAAGDTWGFRWVFSAGDSAVKGFMPNLTGSTSLKCTFMDVYKTPLEINKLGSAVTVPASWEEETVSLALEENTYRKNCISAVLTVPADGYTAFRGTKGAVLELGMWCGKTAVTMQMKQDGSISYLAKQDGTDISKSVYVDAKQQTDGTVKLAFSFKSGSAAAKSLISEKITGLYKITSGSKTLAGSGEKFTLRGVPEKQSAPEKPAITLRGNSRSTAVIAWEKQTGVDGYQVYISVNGGKFKKLDTVGAVPQLYNAEGLDTGKNSYRFRIRGYVKPVGKKALYSKWSNIVKIK